MTRASAAALLASCALVPVAVRADPIPAHFESTGDDRRAIQALLDDYTKAVSGRDQALFESLLLNTNIPFSSVDAAVKANGADGGTQNYETFRKGVFAGAPFRQRFRDVTIRQDGPAAAVSLVFVNTQGPTTSWGWKTMQLLKVAGRWKIASEFFTGHPG